MSREAPKKSRKRTGTITSMDLKQLPPVKDGTKKPIMNTDLVITDLINEDYCNTGAKLDSMNLDLISIEKDVGTASDLELAILLTIKRMKSIAEALSSDFTSPSIDLIAFYETHFKQEQLIDKILPLYVDMYRVANRPCWAEIAADDQRGAQGTPGELKAVKTLQLLEEQWDHLIIQIDEAMTAKWQMNEKNYVDFLDIGTINLVDCERMASVSLRDLLNPKYGRYTLFVLLRYYG